MAGRKRCIMIGAGGFGVPWIRSFLTPFYDRVEIVALVDINPDALSESGDFLELPPASRFTDMHAAFEKVEADFCTVVIPPAHHREAVLAACDRGLPILTEKPIADTWEACLDIVRAVRASGVKCQVIQNYRYAPHILTMKQALRDGRIGRLNYVIGRFAADYRERGAWGHFRHEIPHSLLVEGAVHHLDQIRNLTESDCRTVSGWEWNPGHSSFDGECCGLFVMQMENSIKATYEGNGLAAGWQNNWYSEYYRAEGDEGALVLDSDQTVRLLQFKPGRGLITEELPTVQPEYAAHQAMIHQFLEWLDGGPEPLTAISDNIKSAALLFGAIRASACDEVVAVAELVDEAHADG